MKRLLKQLNLLTAISKLSLIALFTVFSFGLNTMVKPVTVTHAENKSQSEIDELNKQLEETKKKLEDIKNQKAQVVNQIANESKNQGKLKGDAQYIDSVIGKNELQVQALQLDIDQLTLQVNLLQDEQRRAESQLRDLQAKKDNLDKELQASMNLLYKMALDTPTFLEKNSSFEDSVVNEEKQKTVIKIVKADIEETKRIEQEVQAKRDEIDAKAKQTADAQTQKVAQTNNLNIQKQGLEYQKKNKLALIEQSKALQSNLSEKDQQLAKDIVNYQQKLQQLINSLYSAPPSGSPVAAGQVIGFQGRTGLSCDWVSSEQKAQLPQNNYCGFLGSNWYYYDPINYPTKGSHLHFEYWKGGKKVYPEQFLFGGAGEFAYMPMSPMVKSQGYHDGGAIDLASAYGNPVRAIKAGKIQYYCDLFSVDPAYGAVVYHNDGTISQYWHLQKKADSPPCKKLG